MNGLHALEMRPFSGSDDCSMPRPLHPRAQPRKPLGQPTRGKTRPNRLRRVDAFLARYDPGLIRRAHGSWADALVVDLGYGAEPFTALEMAARLRRLNPTLPLLGVEIDPERVAAAQPYAGPRTHFRLGGFNLPLVRDGTGRPESVRLIRAFNVLRQYEESAVADAWARLGSDLLPGGLLLEGTSDLAGDLWVTHVLRKPRAGGDLAAEALVFSTRFRTGFDPAVFQPVLPKSLIHQMATGAPIDRFFTAWKQAAQRTAPLRAWGARQHFAAAARALAASGWRVDPRASWLRDGYLIVREA
jgi:hypothetical protein